MQKKFIVKFIFENQKKNINVRNKSKKICANTKNALIEKTRTKKIKFRR